MTNPKIETDLSEILSRIDSKLDKLSEDINELKIGQAKTDGKIDALDAKTDQIDKRISNQEFFVRGIFIGLLIVIFGGFAMFLWMTSKF